MGGELLKRGCFSNLSEMAMALPLKVDRFNLDFLAFLKAVALPLKVKVALFMKVKVTLPLKVNL